MYKYKTKTESIKIIPFKGFEELHNVNWIATKDETVDACIVGLMNYESDSLQFEDIKTLSLKELMDIRKQHGNITIKEFLNLKYCPDCDTWKDYNNFYKRNHVKYLTYCKECYSIRNKKGFKKWYGKYNNKIKKCEYQKNNYNNKNKENNGE